MPFARRLFIILLTLGVFMTAYFSRQNELLQDFTFSSDSVRTRLSQHVQLSCSFVDQMSLIGEEYYRNGTLRPSPWRAMIKEDAASGTFNMDAVKQTGLDDVVGNLTGVGKPGEDADQIENMELALLYNPHFNAFHESLPGIAWIYYTGSEGFINLFPWAPSTDYQFSTKEFDRPFYRLGMPDTNPSRMRYWTPVYMDAAGKGLMVTVSKPVYDGDTFRGVVSLDFTLKTLSSLMDPQYRSFVINSDNQVLAGTFDANLPSEKILTLDDYLGPEQSQDLALIIYSRSDVLSITGSKYVYATGIDNSPWTLVNTLPQWEVIWKSALFGAPVLLIGLLLLLSNNAYERRRADEEILITTVRDLEDSRHQLESAASIDFLTGALNRRSMTERLTEEISRYERYGTPFSLIMGDLDHFKAFNDLHGHAAGDMALQRVVQVMKEHIRSADLLCRWGGEEFLLMLPDTPCSDAKAAAEKLREAIEAQNFEWYNHKDLHITMTFGVSEYDNIKGLDHSIIEADDALYHAKITGRNRVCSFEDMVKGF